MLAKRANKRRSRANKAQVAPTDFMSVVVRRAARTNGNKVGRENRSASSFNYIYIQIFQFMTTTIAAAESKTGNKPIERRTIDRYPVALPIEVHWQGRDGKAVISKGTTENIGLCGFLIQLPREMPEVGKEVVVTILREDRKPFIAVAIVLRLVRNVACQQVAFQITAEDTTWKKEVFDYAAQIADHREEEPEDWF